MNKTQLQIQILLQVSVIHEPYGSMVAVFIVNEAAPAGTGCNSAHSNDVRRGGISVRGLRKQEKGRLSHGKEQEIDAFNTLNAELNPICHLLVLLGAHHILHISRIRVKP